MKELPRGWAFRRWAFGLRLSVRTPERPTPSLESDSRIPPLRNVDRPDLLHAGEVIAHGDVPGEDAPAPDLFDRAFDAVQHADGNVLQILLLLGLLAAGQEGNSVALSQEVIAPAFP